MIRHGGAMIEISEEERKVIETKSEKLKGVINEFFKFRRNWKQSGKTLEELLEYSRHLLKIGTDCSTIFNFRKELLEEYFNKIKASFNEETTAPCTEKKEAPENQDSKPDDKELKSSPSEEAVLPKGAKVFGEIMKTAGEELKLVTKLGMEDPKSYEIWYHRFWLLSLVSGLERELLGSQTEVQKLIQGDLKITEAYLQKDERNFHVWNYRFELVELILRNKIFSSEEQTSNELAFAEKKLGESVSNHSAIHFFIQYLEAKHLESPGAQIPRELLSKPLQSNLEALYVTSSDQSLWVFQKWLVQALTDKFFLYAKFCDGKLVIWLNLPLSREALNQALTITSDCPNKPQPKDFKLARGGFELSLQLEKEYSYSFKLCSRGLISKIEYKDGQLGPIQRSGDTTLDHLKSSKEAIAEIEVENEESRLFKPLLLAQIELLLSLDVSIEGEEKALDAFTEAWQKCMPPSEDIGYAYYGYLQKVYAEYIEKKKEAIDFFALLL